jgi:hypothetical protein
LAGGDWLRSEHTVAEKKYECTATAAIPIWL